MSVYDIYIIFQHYACAVVVSWSECPLLSILSEYIRVLEETNFGQKNLSYRPLIQSFVSIARSKHMLLIFENVDALL